jgi:hypothetical protein
MRSEFDVLINDGVRANTNGGIQLRFRMNDRRGMNHRQSGRITLQLMGPAQSPALERNNFAHPTKINPGK